MKKSLSIIFIGILVCASTFTVSAQDLLPSEAYYRDNIAVNEISAKAPGLKIDDDEIDPGGTDTGGGPWVGAPLQDAILPILLAGVFYGAFVLYRKRSKKVVK